MRRRDFAMGVLLASATQPVRAEERAKQHRIAIINAGPIASINENTESTLFQPFFEELR